MNERYVSVAVMPFRNLSPEPDMGFFADGFVEDLIAELTRFQSLRVLASQSTFALSQSGRSVEDVAREWGLQYALEGSVRRSESSIRVGTHLIRIHGGQTVWAERFDAPLEQVFSIQDQISATVAGKLAVRIDDARLDLARQRPVEKLPAYDCWLRGMDCLKRGSLEGDDESRAFFRQALEIDPNYARAFAGLSLSHFNEWTCQAWHLWEESERNAFDFASKAVELDDSDAMVHAVLARVCRFRSEHQQADHHIARAMALNPNDPHVLIQVAIAKLFNAEPEDGYALARNAIQLNPLHPRWYHGIVGWNLFMQKRYDDAFENLEKAGETVVNFAAYRAACAVATGDLHRARREYRTFLDEYREKIAFGRGPEAVESLRWAVQVEPFRRVEDSAHMPDLLRTAGLAEVDVENALKSRSSMMVRPAEIARAPGNSFVKEGRVWSIAYEGVGAKLVELKGFYDIARLLARPGEPAHCLELIGAPPNRDSSQEILDAEARRQYRHRIEELQHELESAEADHDPARIDRIRAELDAVIDELTKATGLAGRSRKVGDDAERARSAVTWRIRSAIKKIRAAHPRLAQHFANSVRTGNFCVYSPESAIHWDI